VLAGLGGLLHDIGKVNISTDIINKPDKLSDEELIEKYEIKFQ
jgi:HD-GYP domain-containing protein (c-di-GMP phosphodiesterase class II)